MADDDIQKVVLHIYELVNQNKYDIVSMILPAIHNQNVLLSKDLVTPLISVEQTACCLLKDSFNTNRTINTNSLKYVEQVGLFNLYISMLDTKESNQINNQSQLLLHTDTLKNLNIIIRSLLSDDSLHHHSCIKSLCIWLEAIAHFVHRHDSAFKDLVQVLRQTILDCLFSDWYQAHLRSPSGHNSAIRSFFIRTCSFLTGIFQNNLLSFENALKTAESYAIVLPIGEQIFKRYSTDFRIYLLNQVNNIENDQDCLTGICVLMTNCYNYEVFVDDNKYFDSLLYFLNTDFVRKGLSPAWTNNSTILADTLMVQLKNSSNDANIRLYLQQSQAASVIHQYIHAEYDRLRIQACMLLGVLLDDISIRQLQIPGNKLTQLYFDVTLQAHQSSNKCYKRVPIHMLLRAFAALVHNESIQTSIISKSDYFDILLSIRDDYNIIYDILWTLSFNKKLHETFNSQQSFLEELRQFVDRRKATSEEDVIRAAEGILWNLTDQNHLHASSQKSANNDKTTVKKLDNLQQASRSTFVAEFDAMLSYCWKEKKISKSIFEYLCNKGYRVWFDENNMHGNSLQAMANAIQSSLCIIVCMSENYEKSNACRHEAEYAYVLQRPIVPIVAQSKYKARNWLGFLIGSLIYIDFTKYEFSNAVGKLEEELKHTNIPIEVKRTDARLMQAEEIQEVKRLTSTEYENKCMTEWTQDDVIAWCQAKHLLVISKLLDHFDGKHLLRLSSMSKSSGENAVFHLLQQDCQRISKDNKIALSLIEFVRFQSELETIIEKDTMQKKAINPAEKQPVKICVLL